MAVHTNALAQAQKEIDDEGSQIVAIMPGCGGVCQSCRASRLLTWKVCPVSSLLEQDSEASLALERCGMPRLASHSSTGRTTTCSSRCSTRLRPPRCHRLTLPSP